MDDTLEFLTKIYSELTEFRKETKDDIQGLKNDIIEIENKITGLYDGDHRTSEKLDNHTLRLETIENKLDYLALSVNSQDKRLEVVESTKRRKAK